MSGNFELAGMKTKLTQKQQRDLEVEISFMEGVVRRDSKLIEAWQVLGDDYFKCGLIADGLKVDQKLARLCPRDATVFYNLACSYALNGRCTEAIQALESALSLGYDDYDWLAVDPDLALIRDEPAYVVIEARIRHRLVHLIA
jgi:tetratricopeptide (TPR) repeat protein